MDYVADNDLTVAWEWKEEKTAMMTAYDKPCRGTGKRGKGKGEGKRCLILTSFRSMQR